MRPLADLIQECWRKAQLAQLEPSTVVLSSTEEADTLLGDPHADTHPDLPR